jgi:hypothetical protein
MGRTLSWARAGREAGYGQDAKLGTGRTLAMACLQRSQVLLLSCRMVALEPPTSTKQPPVNSCRSLLCPLRAAAKLQLQPTPAVPTARCRRSLAARCAWRAW